MASMKPPPINGMVTRQRYRSSSVVEALLAAKGIIGMGGGLGPLQGTKDDTLVHGSKSQEEEKLGDASSEGSVEEIHSDRSEPPTFDGQEIVKGLFFGGEACATDSAGRISRGITHVLVLLSAFERDFEADSKLEAAGRWLTFDREDRPMSDLLNIMDKAVSFIQHALDSQGSVCVVSYEGVSRSATICLAFLIKQFGMTLRSAHELAISHKPNVMINRGFWRQLVVYEGHIRGCTSFTEAELPGAIIFEKEGLDLIASKFLARGRLERQQSLEKFHKEQLQAASEWQLEAEEEQVVESVEQLQPQHSCRTGPLSPTTATGIASMTIGSPRGKRKMVLDWNQFGSDQPKSKSPRNSIDYGAS